MAENTEITVVQGTVDMRTLLLRLRRGSCWCEAGVGNPNVGGKHTETCVIAQSLVSILRLTEETQRERDRAVAQRDLLRQLIEDAAGDLERAAKDGIHGGAVFWRDACQTVSEHLREGLVRGVCRVCGCTDTMPCMMPDGRPCGWTDETETLCTACVVKEGDPPSHEATEDEGHG